MIPYPFSLGYLLLTLALLMLATAGTDAQLTPPPDRMGRLSGRILLEGTDSAAAGVTVTVEGTALTATVGADGRFYFMEIPQGSYRVQAGGIGFESVVVERIEIIYAKTTEITISVRTTTLPSSNPVVTPGKRLQPRREASSSLHVLTAGDISQRNAHTLDRLLEMAPGVQSGEQRISIRGSDGSDYGVGSRVMLLVDGFPMLQPDNGAIPSMMLPLAAADQVEVIKGAASVLHGSGVIGGVVNIVTREPAEQTQAMIRSYTGVYTAPSDEDQKWWGAGVQRTYGVEASFSRKSGDVGLMLSGGTHHDDGYRQNDDRDRYNLHARMIWTLNPRSSFRVAGAIAGDDHGGFARWRSADSALFSPVSSDSVERRIVNESNMLNGELRGYISELLSYVIRGGFTNTSLSDSLLADGGQPADSGQPAVSESSRYFGELHMTSRLNRNVMFAYGGSMEFDIGSSALYGQRLTRSTGLFVQMEFGNNIDINATIGGRVDLLLAPGADVSREIHISPRVGLAYHPFDGTSVRFSIGRGFRAPTMFERYMDATVAGFHIVPNRALASERSWQGELGIAQEFRLTGITLTADASLFVHEHFGLIAPLVNQVNREIIYSNVMRARVLGAEMIATGMLDVIPIRFSFDLSTFSPRDLNLGVDLPGRSDFISHLGIAWAPGPFTFSIDYRYLSVPESTAEAWLALVPDASLQSQTNNLDLRVALDMRTVMNLPVVGMMTVRNLMQDRYTSGVGRIGGIRSVEVGVEGRF